MPHIFLPDSLSDERSGVLTDEHDTNDQVKSFDHTPVLFAYSEYSTSAYSNYRTTVVFADSYYSGNYSTYSNYSADLVDRRCRTSSYPTHSRARRAACLLTRRATMIKSSFSITPQCCLRTVNAVEVMDLVNFRCRTSLALGREERSAYLRTSQVFR